MTKRVFKENLSKEKIAILNNLTIQLCAKIAGMNAENDFRKTKHNSIPYVEETFRFVLYMHENSLISYGIMEEIEAKEEKTI